MKQLFFILFMTSSIALQAQGLYFGGNVGYGMAGNSESTGSGISGLGEMLFHGHGLGYSLSCGYLFNKNIGAELGASYFFAKKSASDDEDGALAAESTDNSERIMKSFYLNPCFVMRANPGKIVPYGKAGIFLGLSNSGKYHDVYDFYDNVGAFGGSSKSDETIIYQGGLGVGMTTAIGIDFMLSDRFALFGELFGRISRWNPAKSSESKTISSLDIPHSDVTTIVSYANYNGYTLKPLWGVSLNIGVKYYLSKK